MIPKKKVPTIKLAQLIRKVRSIRKVPMIMMASMRQKAS